MFPVIFVRNPRVRDAELLDEAATGDEPILDNAVVAGVGERALQEERALPLGIRWIIIGCIGTQFTYHFEHRVVLRSVGTG